MTEREKLIKGMQADLKQDPGGATDYLAAITEALLAFKEAEKTKRDNLTDVALRMVLCDDHFDTLPIPQRTPVMLLQFPKATAKGYSQGERRSLFRFYLDMGNYLQKDPGNKRWVESMGYRLWWDKLCANAQTEFVGEVG